MRRIVKFSIALVLFMAAWAACLTGTIKVAEPYYGMVRVVWSFFAVVIVVAFVFFTADSSFRFFCYLFRQAPLYAIILFGCYSLASIGWNLIVFRDCAEADAELRKVGCSLRRFLVSGVSILPCFRSCRKSTKQEQN
jgi:hypothetical protein